MPNMPKNIKNMKNMLTGHADMVQNAFGSSTMVGEHFEIYCPQIVENTPLVYPPWLEEILKFSLLK